MKALLLFFAFLLGVLSGCNPMPGSDTEIRNFSVEHSGIATITKVYSNNGEDCVDFLWKAENNIGTPESVTQLKTKDIEGLVHAEEIKVGDKLNLHVTHLFRQEGATTPYIVKSLWVMSKTMH